MTRRCVRSGCMPEVSHGGNVVGEEVFTGPHQAPPRRQHRPASLVVQRKNHQRKFPQTHETALWTLPFLKHTQLELRIRASGRRDRQNEYEPPALTNRVPTCRGESFVRKTKRGHTRIEPMNPCQIAQDASAGRHSRRAKVGGIHRAWNQAKQPGSGRPKPKGPTIQPPSHHEWRTRRHKDYGRRCSDYASVSPPRLSARARRGCVASAEKQ